MLLRDASELRRHTQKVREYRGPIALDTEFSGPLQVKISKNQKPVVNQHLADLTGFSFSYDGHKAYYVPVRHREGNAPRSEALGLLIALCQREGAIILWNAKADAHVLNRLGVVITAPVIDAMTGAWLTTRDWDDTTLGLKQQAKFRLGMNMASFVETLGNKAQIADVKPEDAADYAGDDALATFRCWAVYEKILNETDQMNAFGLEMSFMPVLIKMEQTGMALDCEYLERLHAELEPRQRDMMKQWELLAPGVNPNSPKQLREHFYNRGYWCRDWSDVTKKTKEPATNIDALESQLAHLPVDSYGSVCARLLLDISEVDKIVSTYTTTLVENARQYPDGRLHPSFNQMVARTGRLSCSYPNLQNIPVRSDFGKQVRKAFVVPEGYTLLSCDYSQIEARVLAHYAGPGSLREAFEAEEDIHDQIADALGISRYDGKTLNYTMIFGAGPKKVARQLGKTLSEAKSLLRQFEELRSDVVEVKKRMTAAGMHRGWVKTISGRRRYLDMERLRRVSDPRQKKLLEWAYGRRFVNTPVQGSAADIMKKATVEVAEKLHSGARLVCQVHDENLFEIPTALVEVFKETIVSTMEKSTVLDVPIIVTAGSGACWAEAK